MLHELLHFKSYNALQVTLGEAAEVKDYRVGLTVRTRDGKARYFTTLNEAVTEELTKRLALPMFEAAVFADECRQTRAVKDRYQNVAAPGTGILSDEIFYVRSEADGSAKDARGEQVSYVTFGHSAERAILKPLVDQIFERHRDQFTDRQAVFEVFATVMITGDLLPRGPLG